MQDLIPPELRAAVQAGPAEGDSWCLLVQAAPLPPSCVSWYRMLQARLKAKGWDVATIRIKVQARR